MVHGRMKMLYLQGQNTRPRWDAVVLLLLWEDGALLVFECAWELFNYEAFVDQARNTISYVFLCNYHVVYEL